jgi:hypothetical protein
MKKQNISNMPQNRHVKYPVKTGINDTSCTGINPLSCVICQENRKLEGNWTCGNEFCLSEFFSICVKPDTNEARITKTWTKEVIRND